MTARQSVVRRQIRQMVFGVFLLDCGVLLVTSAGTWQIRDLVDNALGFETMADAWAPWYGPGYVALWVLALAAFGAYRTNQYGGGLEEFRSIGQGSLAAFGIVVTIQFLFGTDESRGYAVLFLLVGTAGLMLVRYLDRKSLHAARSHGRLLIRTLGVGSPTSVAEFAEVLERAPWLGYRIVGMCTPGGVEVADHPIPHLGDVSAVRSVVLEHNLDAVLVAGGSYSSSRDLRRLGWALQGLDVAMLVVPSLTDVAGPRVQMRHVAGLPLAHVEEPQGGRAGGVSKRAFDLIATSLGMIVVAPVMALVAAAIWLDDRGPVFYRQVRKGREGADFTMLKFRSMVVDADQQLAELQDANEHDGVLFKIKDDPRITRVGRVLRRLSLDELPQLINVLRGEMSLVGPRPPLPEEVARYETDTERRLMVRPGMTGLWQVSGRSDLSWAESVRLDLYYVDNWSMVMDLVLMIKTVRAVLRREGAY